ncbi:unnamed protein product [Caenorhabditis auriculariae]|uniref:DDHD domain-containing protein n=1 Tax=Caenorhabditis auriculariae TaxID=2777116 RepID=A0A8S1HYI2_9PELO|nr:unnamed protein product [Caenorhabditis auriculariae]
MGKLALRSAVFLRRTTSTHGSLAPTTAKSSGIQKRKDDEMLETIDIEDLPRPQRRFAKQFEKVNEERVKEIFAKNYKNHIALAVLLSFVVGIYYYTIYAVKQETFLEEIDREMAQEKPRTHEMNTEEAIVPDEEESLKEHLKAQRDEIQRQLGCEKLLLEEEAPLRGDVPDPQAENGDETPTAQVPTSGENGLLTQETKPARPFILPDSAVVNASDGLNIPPGATPISVASPRSAVSPLPKQPPSTPIPPVRNRKRKVTELKCSEVRWFYQEPKGSSWIPFNGRDSLLLELKFRKEKNIELDDQMKAIEAEMPPIEVSDGESEEKPMVVVQNGQYRVDDENMKIIPIYWKDDTKEIRRGTWFSHDYQPIEMQLSDQIERNHLQYFRGQTIPEGTTVFSKAENSNKPVLAELHTETYDVRWSSVIDISLHQRSSNILRYLWAKSHSLRRGYEKEAEWTDSSAEISHLILVVHGIGQKGYENLIAQNANQVRDGVVSAMEKCYPDEKSRPMFLPVEWRASLVLDNGVTDLLTIPKMSSMRASLNSTAMDVMYYQSPLFRTEIVRGVVTQMNRVYKLFKANNPDFKGHVSIFGHSLGSVICYDILTKFSPLVLYDKYVTKSVDEFLDGVKDDPSCQKAREAMETLKEARQAVIDNLEGGMEKLLVTKEEQLDFKVKYLFAVGSPLAVFLVMRNANSSNLMPSTTNVDRIFNIFHPYDPVAYRLEPFFAPEYRHIRPLKLFSSTDLRGRASYDSLPLEVYKQYMKKLKNQNKKKKGDSGGDKSVDARSGGDDEIDEEDECDSDDDARSGCSSPRSSSPPPGENGKDAKEAKAKKGWFSFGSTASKKAAATVPEAVVEVAKEAEQELPLPERILGGATRVPHRIDVQLQPALTDKSYWSVFKSHFAYWTNPDLALFIANVLYCKPMKPEEAKSSWA